MKEARTRLLQVGKAVRLVWESAPGWTVLQAGTMAAQGIIPVAALFLTKRVVDEASAFLGHSTGDRDPRGLVVLILLMGIVTLAGWLCRAVSSVAVEAQSEAVSEHVQESLQRKSIEVDLEYYETSAYYDQMQLAQAEAMSRPLTIVSNLAQLGSSVLALAAVAGVIGSLEGLLLAVLLLAVAPAAGVRVLNSRRWNQWRIAQGPSERKASYLHFSMTASPFAKEIRLNGNGGELRRRFREVRRGLRRGRLLLTRRRVVAELAADVVSAAAMGGGLVLVYLRMRSGAVTLGDFALIYAGMNRGKAALSGALSGIASLYEASLFVGHYYEFLALPQHVASPTVKAATPRMVVDGIQLEHVSFRYPGTGRDVLLDVNLTIRAGEHVALVGENGSGKTTLVKLLCRLYDPTAGRILLDGTDIRDFGIEELRSTVRCLFQDFGRYQMTALENVWMGDVSIPPDSPEVAEAARRAGASEVIERLPRGYETLLGRLFEGGSELSEGQWQRLALARAFLKPGPIILLDEPTSAMDGKAERQLFDVVRTEFSGKTVLVVSHRLSTVLAADRIVAMRDGRIVESGTHEELLRSRGFYADLFSRQRSADGASVGPP